MKKIIILFFALILFSQCIQAKSVKSEVLHIINDSGIKKDSIAVSIRNAKDGKTVYALNDSIMMNPASVQKVLTMTAAEQILGQDYKFSTELYSEGENNYLIKLSGDPYLKYSDLKALTKSVKLGSENIFIDDNILDKKYWG